MSQLPKTEEAYHEAVNAGAVQWTAFQFRGRGARYKAVCASLEAAIAAGHTLLSECGERAVLVYAIDQDGRQTLVANLRR